MKTKTVLLGLVGAPCVGTVLGLLLGLSSNTTNESSRPIVGSVRTFEAAYERWKADAERSGQATKIVLSLGHFKGLSSEFSEARGTALLDLADGSLSVTVAGLPNQQNYDFWLVHNRPGPGRSVKPEDGDRLILAGRLTRQGENAVLTTRLEHVAVADFKLDLMVVTAAGRSPADRGLLFAAPNVFQKLYYSDRSAEKLSLTSLGGFDADTSPLRHLLFTPFRSLIPNLAYADRGGIANLRSLLVRGERLFFEETFKGNGRTCGTCHPAENNFTIDPAFIATLPAQDPLFVAEFNKDLNADFNGGKHFEIPALMRQFGLVLENVDGFDDLTTKFVMRGTPHTFAQAVSITPATFDGTSASVLHRLGWGGDGAPGNGTLREFAIGAVTQHFTRTLNRNPKVDFRLPNDAELDAMEAFMLSLGRQSELDLNALQDKLVDADVSAGLALFNDGTKGKCAFCHFNAGANHGIPIGAPLGTQNANFNTGVEARAASLGLLGALRPVDGGFGRAGTLEAGYGNGTFNTPSLVESADKRTQFHNNLCTSIECAVEFYNTDEFNDSPAGLLLQNLPPRLPLSLGQEESFKVAAFLRVINALENIRAATEKLDDARVQNESGKLRMPELRKRIGLAIADIRDAYRVLDEGRDPQFKREGLHPDARTILAYAKENCDMIQSSRGEAQRNYRIAEALQALATAKSLIVNP